MTARIPVARADLQVGDVVTWRRIVDGELVERTEAVVHAGNGYVETASSWYFRGATSSSSLEVVSAYRPAPGPEVTVTPRRFDVEVGGCYVGKVYADGTPGPSPYYASPPVGADGVRRDTYHTTLDEAVAALVAAWEARS